MKFVQFLDNLFALFFIEGNEHYVGELKKKYIYTERIFQNQVFTLYVI